MCWRSDSGRSRKRFIESKGLSFRSCAKERAKSAGLVDEKERRLSFRLARLSQATKEGVDCARSARWLSRVAGGQARSANMNHYLMEVNGIWLNNSLQRDGLTWTGRLLFAFVLADVLSLWNSWTR